MSQRGGFSSGFLLGAVFGGIVGGVAGAIAASRIKGEKTAKDSEWLEEDEALHFDTEDNMELARRSLENKIAQLNGAIDDVRQQMSVIHSANGQDAGNS